MRQFFKSYWVWFYLTVGIISVVDFADHVTRTDSSYFRDNLLAWFLFTLTCTLTVCLSVYLINNWTKKLFKADNLIFQSIALVLAMLIHIYLSGPIYDRLIFGQVTLNFQPKPIIFVLGLSIFYIVRLLFHLVIKMSYKHGGQDVSV